MAGDVYLVDDTGCCLVRGGGGGVVETSHLGSVGDARSFLTARRCCCCHRPLLLSPITATIADAVDSAVNFAVDVAVTEAAIITRNNNQPIYVFVSLHDKPD